MKSGALGRSPTEEDTIDYQDFHVRVDHDHEDGYVAAEDIARFIEDRFPPTTQVAAVEVTYAGDDAGTRFAAFTDDEIVILRGRLTNAPGTRYEGLGEPHPDSPGFTLLREVEREVEGRPSAAAIWRS